MEGRSKRAASGKTKRGNGSTIGLLDQLGKKNDLLQGWNMQSHLFHHLDRAGRRDGHDREPPGEMLRCEHRRPRKQGAEAKAGAARPGWTKLGGILRVECPQN